MSRASSVPIFESAAQTFSSQSLSAGGEVKGVAYNTDGVLGVATAATVEMIANGAITSVSTPARFLTASGTQFLGRFRGWHLRSDTTGHGRASRGVECHRGPSGSQQRDGRGERTHCSRGK